MAVKIDFGSLSADETKNIAIEALAQLSLDERIGVVKAAFDDDEKFELVAHFQED